MEYNKVKMRIGNLKSGMIAANDILNINGSIILGKNTVLNDEIIEALKQYPIFTINVILKDEDEIIKNDIGKKEGIINFKDIYKQTKDELMESINDIIFLDEKIDINLVVENISQMISKVDINGELLKLLNNMRINNKPLLAHSLNVALISSMIGRWCKLSPLDLDYLLVCAIVHDVGMLRFSKELFLNRTKMSVKDIRTMQKHAIYGYNMLKDRGFTDARILNVILFHHERCDGSGYPFGKEKTEIDSFTIIISIADIYDNITTEKNYQERFLPFEAVNILETNGHRKFNTHYLSAFLTGVMNNFLNCRVLLNTGQKGKIIYINKSNLAYPTISVENKYIDLSINKHIKVVGLI